MGEKDDERGLSKVEADPKTEYLQKQFDSVDTNIEVTKHALGHIRNRSLKLRTMKTNQKFIKKRKGVKDKIFDYVDWGYCAMWLDNYYPGWSMEVVGEPVEYAGFLNVTVKLTVMEPTGLQRTVTSIGSQPIVVSDGKPTYGYYYKGAESDGMKRSAAKLGMAFDIYSRTAAGDEYILEVSDEDFVEFMEVIYPLLKEVPELNDEKRKRVVTSFMNAIVDLETIKKRLKL